MKQPLETRLPTSAKFVDLTNRKFARLTVVSFAGFKNKHAHWNCECECGEQVVIDGTELKNGHTKSCGCIRLSDHPISTERPEYRIWQAMKNRCLNPNVPSYVRYGATGKRVCARWRTNFNSFIEDIGTRPTPQHSIDRINNDGHYSCGKCDECLLNQWPANVRWATPVEQAANRSSTLSVTFQGKTLPLSEWAKKIGIKYGTLYNRIVLSGWPIEQAMQLAPDSNNRIK